MVERQRRDLDREAGMLVSPILRLGSLVRRRSGFARKTLSTSASGFSSRSAINPSESIQMPGDPKVPDTRFQRAGSRILYSSLGPRDEGWLLNRQLSRACRRGEFKQRADRRYVALFAGEVYGAGIGGHGSLIDKARRGIPQTLYIFKGQGTTYCRVYHRSQG